MNSSLELHSPAKLNLFLHITGQRPDGYHELQTLFQLLDWGDRMRFETNSSGQITLDCPGLDIPAQDNLAYRAAQALQSGDLGVNIQLEKHIPTGGGLGGGSSNAATTLLALNHLWRLGKSPRQLQDLGAKLGADVPVFIAGHSAWAEGIGEQLTPIEIPTRWYLIIAPDCQISTGDIFSHQQLTRNTSPIKIAAFFAGHSRNDCQDLVRRLYPEVDNALNFLEKFGEARMTGTGACVFTDFEDKATAEAAHGKLPSGWTGFLAQGIDESPVLAALA